MFEETGYETNQMVYFSYQPDYFIDDELEGKHDEKFLQKFLIEVETIVYFAIINDLKDPVIDPKEHTDWKWCD